MARVSPRSTARKPSTSKASKSAKPNKSTKPTKAASPESIAQLKLDEANANTQAVLQVMQALSNVTRVAEATKIALDTVKSVFGWAYASYWALDPAENVLKFAVESGSVNDNFRRVTMEARFREGEGLSGRAWKQRDLFFTPDISQMTDCCRAPEAKKAGVKSGVCFPVIVAGNVVGTMDFFALEVLDLSKERIAALRGVGSLVSATIARLDQTEQLQERAANTIAVNRVLEAVGSAKTVDEAAKMALDTVKTSFGWAYGSYWKLDPKENALKFAVESGTVNEEFRKVTMAARFHEGEGLSGRAWKTRDLYFTPDIGQMVDCCRAPVAQKAGVKAGVCFPVLIDGNVVATMDFFALESITLSQERMEALRRVGSLVSTTATRLADAERQAEIAENTAAINKVMSAVQNAQTADDAAKAALDTVKAAFGWAYGSYWKIDPKENALRFALESGSVNEEFRKVTMEARFREGEGLSGRTWKQADLFFTPDIGQMVDCCRAPIAQRAGVKSGVCLPIIVFGKVVATMDFFSLATLHPSKERLEALRNVGRMVSAAVERVIKETDNARIGSMMHNMAAGVTYADNDFVIRYVNPAAETLLQPVEKHLPVKANQLLGQSIDIFYADPARQRATISNLKNLPAKSRVEIGEEKFDLETCAVYDQFKNHIGYFVSWTNITETERKIKAAADEERKKAEELQAKVDSLLVNMSAAAQGDLTQLVQVSGSDGVGQMGEALAAFLDSLRGSIQSIGLHATALASSSEEFSSVAAQMSANAEETANQSNVVSAASEQVSKNMMTVSTAIEEMSASIREIAKSASDAARISSGAVSVANGANATITKLGDSSTEIGKVIKVITSIAEQTNLLALNATIEAARAGEAGKGFAVVANEVKELAKETAKATEDISRKIETIQADSKGAVEAIKQISQIIGQMNDISNTIAGAVEEQTATTSEMARNISEATTGTGEIVRNIVSVANAAQSTTEGAGNTQRAAVELSRMAAELQSLVGQFVYDRPAAVEPSHAARPIADNGMSAAKPVSANGGFATANRFGSVRR